MHERFKGFTSMEIFIKSKYDYHINTVKKGFTLIEVLIAITIIAILTVIVTPNLIGKVNEAKVKVDISNARAIAMAVKTELMSGTAPSSITAKKLADDYFDGAIPTPQSASDQIFNFKIDGNKVIVTLGSKTLYPATSETGKDVSDSSKNNEE